MGLNRGRARGEAVKEMEHVPVGDGIRRFRRSGRSLTHRLDRGHDHRKGHHRKAAHPPRRTPWVRQDCPVRAARKEILTGPKINPRFVLKMFGSARASTVARYNGCRRAAILNTDLIDDAVSKIMDLANLMDSLGERRYGGAFEHLASDLQSADTPGEVRDAVHQGLLLYGGMNSFNDFVVMDGTVPDRAKNRRLDVLRSAVYDSLVRMA